MIGLERVGEAWRLPCEGLRVSQIRIDHAFGLELAEDQHRATDDPWRIRINTPFRYWRAGRTDAVIDPEGPAEQVACALAVRHQTLRRGRIEGDGRLTLQFADGDVICVAPHDRYEAWEASGGNDANRMFLVSPIAPDLWVMSKTPGVRAGASPGRGRRPRSGRG